MIANNKTKLKNNTQQNTRAAVLCFQQETSSCDETEEGVAKNNMDEIWIGKELDETINKHLKYKHTAVREVI